MSNAPIDESGPAFPAMLPGGNYCTPGMSLRDWFAGQALAGFFTTDNRMPDETIARQCYGAADALIAFRDQQPDTTTAQHVALGIGGAK